jgi:hypothetical protein
MDEKITQGAESFWDSMPEKTKKMLLDNVFCSNCGITTIKNYEGKMRGGDLVLTGFCSQCGKKVGRLIERKST